MDKANLYGKMEIDMMVIGLMIYLMEKEE